ncbi:NUDIX domain-containing protein [Paenibacillus allorhizosphaerae]|uniref:RNA pyrophosphohydrolase n=1 Tax=Paenibacillus allorhizosphaerae TaxID=2849866 RepID=A0ABN7TQS6_9BACL|nr:NUDIX domain-containing protein [Paenibacillus allorhizosphaerae]CAG7646595.1 RNA pyrophosphohydrolase [Paenibacillus allorhizosphaerae]
MALQKWLYRLARMYWKIRRPVTMGSRAIIRQDGNILLIRQTYVEGWYLPGGGVKRGESFQQAIIREVAEECGLEAVRPKLLQLYFSRNEGKIDHIALFEITEFSAIARAKTDAEIAELRFFALDDLPEDTSPATRRRIGEYAANQFRAERW